MPPYKGDRGKISEKEKVLAREQVQEAIQVGLKDEQQREEIVNSIYCGAELVQKLEEWEFKAPLRALRINFDYYTYDETGQVRRLNQQDHGRKLDITLTRHLIEIPMKEDNLQFVAPNIVKDSKDLSLRRGLSDANDASVRPLLTYILHNHSWDAALHVLLQAGFGDDFIMNSFFARRHAKPDKELVKSLLSSDLVQNIRGRRNSYHDLRYNTVLEQLNDLDNFAKIYRDVYGSDDGYSTRNNFSLAPVNVEISNGTIRVSLASRAEEEIQKLLGEGLSIIDAINKVKLEMPENERYLPSQRILYAFPQFTRIRTVQDRSRS